MKATATKSKKRKATNKGTQVGVATLPNGQQCPVFFRQLVWIMCRMDDEGGFYPLTYGNGLPRIYERDKYDSRLKGFGKLPYIDDYGDAVRHFLNKDGERKDAIPVQIPTQLMREFGFKKRDVDAALNDYYATEDIEDDDYEE